MVAMAAILAPYGTGSGSGFVTGGVAGDFSGGSGATGSCVDDTGSVRGITVYLLTGGPICAIADPPFGGSAC
jgi:hypothetical protein